MAQAKKRRVSSQKNNQQPTKTKVKFVGEFSTLLMGMFIGSFLTAIYMGYLIDPLKGWGSGLNTLYSSIFNKDVQVNQVDVREGHAEKEQTEKKIAYDYPVLLHEVERLIPTTPIEEPVQTKSPAIKSVEAPKAVNVEVVNTEEVAPKKNSYYILQAASYNKKADAESLRAKLAINGTQSYIQPVTVDGRNYYRVRMGPFNDLSSMRTSQTTLSKLGLQPMQLEVTKPQ